MGATKEWAAQEDEKFDAACEIAVRVGLLEQCELHDYLTDPYEDEKLESAYKLGNKLITDNDSLVEVFKGDRAELTDILKDICSNFGDCPVCAGHEEDDSDD